MLIAVLLSLSALSVNGQLEQNGFRKNRQLDLGLQDIEKTPPTEQSKPEDLRTLDFVPPLSNTYLPAKFDSSSNQQSQSFESANVNGKQKELCKPPFDSTLCKGDDVEKPSQDLVPPFNNLGEGAKAKSEGATAKPQSEDAPTTVAPTTEQAEAEPEVTTVKVTTVKVATTKAAEPAQTTAPAETSSAAASVAATTTTAPSSAEVTTTEKVADEADASNEQEKSLPTKGREYLPPPPGEIAAAAQTNIAVIEPLNQPDHDHHHHHHDENFNICADPFHSFLCAPLKTRRRITGALPDKFKESNSFLQYQKALPNYFENQGASSNAVQNGYLPPKTNGFPGNQIQTTFASFTTKEPAFTTTTTVRPFSQYNTYTTSRPLSQFNTYTTSRPFSQYNTYTTSRPYSQFNTYTTSRPFSPFSQTSNNYDKTYIPPFTGSPASNPFTGSPASNPFTGSPASNPSFYSSPSNQVFGSRIPTTPAASTIKTADNTFIPGSTFINPQSTYKTVNPSFPTYKPFSSNEDRSYLPPDQKFPSPSFVSPVQNYYQPSTSTRPQTSTFGSAETYNPPAYNFVNQKPSPTYQPFGSYNPVTSSPAYQTFGSFNSGTSSVRPAYTNTFSSSYKPFSQGVYNTNQPKYQAGSNNYISTTIKPFTTIKPTYSQAPTKDNYYLPPDPREPAAAQVSAATVAAPQNSKPLHQARDPCTDPFHSFLCSGPKPRKRITGALPGINGESTKTNEQRAPAPSNQNENIIRPDKIEGAPAQNVGYKYPLPPNTFPTPSPTLPPFSASTGYSYPKPNKGFPLPSLPSQPEIKVTTQEPETSSTSTVEAKSVNAHETSQPDKSSPTDQGVKVAATSAPTTANSHQRPQKTSPLTTEQKEVRQRPVETSTYRQSASSLPGRGKGYQYNKPDQTFRLPDKKGYSYPKPDKRFELPAEGRRKALPSQANSSLDPVRNLGSADFIPVNKVDFKRSRPTNSLAAGLRRFGERLRTHERKV